MKTVYLLVVALAVPLIASGQDTKSTEKVDNTSYRIGKKLNGYAPNVLFNTNKAYGDALTYTQPFPKLDVYRNNLKSNPQAWTYSNKNNTLKSLTLEPNSALVYSFATGEN